jgi:hypothetical protein
MLPVTKVPQRRAIEKSKASGSDTAPLPSHSKPPTTKAVVEVETVAAMDRRVKIETQIKSLVNAVQDLSARLDNLGSVPATLADVKKSLDELINRGEGPSDAEYGGGPEDFDFGGWGAAGYGDVESDSAETKDRAEEEEIADEAGENQAVSKEENEMQVGEADDAAQEARSPVAEVSEGNLDAPVHDDEEGQRDAEGEEEVPVNQEEQGEDAAQGVGMEMEIAGED